MTTHLTAHPLLSVAYGVGRFENAGSQGGACVSTGLPEGPLAEFEARFRECESDVVHLCRRMLGMDAAKDAAHRWISEGRRVRIAYPGRGLDFNDLLCGRVPEASGGAA